MYTYPFSLPKLAYGYHQLLPYIDEQTMRIHHTKHHQGYINNLNRLWEEEQVGEEGLNALLANINDYSAALRNNAGGHFNHAFFWQLFAPHKACEHAPAGPLATAIDKTFGSFKAFKEQFAKAAAAKFGSGWAWLVMTRQGLAITSTANQDNPLMNIANTRGIPLLGLDVWEHAYYLHYQNRRADYIKAFWHVVNWATVNARYIAPQE
jgi:Fe-Mn family superoxide dismutase